MDEIIILGHENPDVDSIVSGYLLEKILIKDGYNVRFVIPDKTIDSETMDICIRYGLDPKDFMMDIDLNSTNKRYILVDHHERDVMGKIVCIFDHHPTSKSFDLKHYYNNAISSTACLIASGNEALLDSFDMKLACLATLVDTVSFHSTKGRNVDREWVVNLCNLYGFNYDELYREGLCFTSLSDLNIASLNGLKKYNYNGKIVESSYIQIENPLVEENNIFNIINILKKRVLSNNLDYFIFIVYDMTNFNTVCYSISKDGVSEKNYDVYASRGNTIMPDIENKVR